MRTLLVFLCSALTLIPQAPTTFRVRLETSKGPIVVEAHRDWAPLGADRFFNLVKNGFYDDATFFRVLPGFMAQFGMHGDPQQNEHWEKTLKSIKG